MTLNPNKNKYTQNFNNIRLIQKFNLKKAQNYLIPRVDNANIDRSIGLIHSTVIRCMRKI